MWEDISHHIRSCSWPLTKRIFLPASSSDLRVFQTQVLAKDRNITSQLLCIWKTPFLKCNSKNSYSKLNTYYNYNHAKNKDEPRIHTRESSYIQMMRWLCFSHFSKFSLILRLYCHTIKRRGVNELKAKINEHLSSIVYTLSNSKNSVLSSHFIILEADNEIFKCQETQKQFRIMLEEELYDSTIFT